MLSNVLPHAASTECRLPEQAHQVKTSLAQGKGPDKVLPTAQENGGIKRFAVTNKQQVVMQLF